MAHVAFSIAPYAGHINPSLAVVAELARRGHRVSYATTEQFAAVVRAAGAEPVLHQTTLRRPAGAASPGAAGGGDFVWAHRGLLRELAAVAPALIGAFGDDPADVVVCDPMSWAGRVLAGRWGVPAVYSVTSMITSGHWSLGPAGGTFSPAHPGLPALFAATSAALARYGAGLTADRLLGTDAGTPGGAEVIAYYPRAFAVRGTSFGPGVSFVGPCLRSRPGAGPAPGWPSGGEPVVLVSLGTVVNRQPALFRRCAEAFDGLGYQVVLALGGMDAAELGRLPGYARAHDYLPLAEVMRHAAVFVGHGGMASTMEALSWGVPIVALPQIAEQRVTAARIAELGLGVGLDPPRQTPDALREAVAAIERDDGIAARLDWMRAEIEQSPGPAAAAGVIENVMRHSNAVRG